MRVPGVLAFASLLLLSSCGDDSDSPITKGEYCDSTGTAFCNRGVECQLGTFNACFQGFKGGCCLNDGSCSRQLTNASDVRALEEKCVAALSTAACSDIA